MTRFVASPFGRLTTMVTAMVLGAASFTVAETVASPTAATPAQAASGTPVTSSDGRITLTKTASTTSLGATGGSVTYTYKVVNNTANDEYYDSFNDDRCGSPSEVSGMSVDDYGADIIPAHGTATFNCTQKVTTTTTNNATFVAEDYNQYYFGNGRTSSVTASATVIVSAGTGSFNCDTLWYGSLDNGSYYGSLGTWDPAAKKVTKLFDLSPGNGFSSTYDSTAATAVSAANPNVIYFTTRTYNSNSGSFGHQLYSYDASKGTSTLVDDESNSGSPIWDTNRLGAAPDGTLWSLTAAGRLLSYNPANDAITDHGVPKLSGVDFTQLNSGDLTFDGLGNMWILSSSGNTGDGTPATNLLVTIPASQLSGQNPQATKVGDMGSPATGGYFNGLSFRADGTLYATATDTSGNPSLYTVNKDTGAVTSVDNTQSGTTRNGSQTISDLGSCALPAPNLVVSKTVDQTSIGLGGTLTYTVTIKNTGTLSATGVNWTDATPANTTYVSSTLNGTAVGTTGTNYWTSAEPVNGATTKESGVIPAGDTATIKMTVKVNSTTNGATAVCNQGTSAYTGSTVPIKSDDPTQSGSTDATCSQILKPAIAVTKTASPTTLQGSGPVTYTYKVTNAGNESLKTVSLGDDKCTAVSGPAAKDTTVTPATGDVNANNQLDVGETWLYSCTQTLSATTTNTATATGTGVTTGTKVTSTAKATVTVTPASINIAKTSGTVSGPDASGNYTVSYTVTATNTGNGAGSYGPIVDTPQFASNLVPTQAAWSGAQSGNQALKASDKPAYGFTMGAARTLAAGATDTYTVQTTFHYTNRTQAVACGGTGTGLYNAVSASGETGSTSDNAACVAPPAPPAESLSITKTPNPTTWTKVGDKVTYSFLVKNTGAVTMNNIQVSDTFTNPPAGTGAMTPISCPTTTLAPGASTTCTATYTITQADLDKGKVDNSATATGTPPDTGTPVTSPPSTAETTSKATPSIGVVKTAGTPTDVNKDGLTDAGDTVVYTFVVTNTGTVTLNRPAAGWNSDAKIGSSNINCPTGSSSLAPGASVTCTSNAYTITAADVATGAVNNTDTATGVPADGSPNVTSQSSANVPTTTPAPSLSVSKAASQTTYKLGDVVKYTFTVTNTGNVPLSQIGVSDTFSTGGTGSATQVTCQATTLAAGAKTTCTFSYTVNQADVDAGRLVNTGAVTGTSPDGTKPTATSNQVTLTDNPAPALKLAKSVQAVNDTNGNGITDAGDTISWNFVVSNTGNVTLAMPNGGWVNDSKLGASAISCQANGVNVTSLAPGAKVTCTATPYTITSSDVGNGSVQNTATAHGTTPGGSTVPSNDSSTTTPTDSPAPGLSLAKSVSDAAPGGNGDGTAQAGEKLTYSFVVKNTGNVEMDAVSVSDDSFTGSGTIGAISCPQDSLAAGAQMTCTTTYTVTQADVDAANAASNGVLVNTAHATGTPAGSNTPQDSNTSTAQIPTPTSSSVTITKSVSDASGNGDGKAQSGEKLTYSFVITNTGSVTLTNVTATDSFTKGGTGVAGDMSCPSASLAPGASETCTMSYTTAAADMDQTSIDNQATASGTTPSGTTVKSTPSNATIPTDANPAITVVKKVARVRDVNTDGITDAGDTINWTITVTNSGNTDLTNVAVQDPMLANASVAVTCPATTLAVGASMQCTTGNYTITTDDQSAGVVKNVATGTATWPGNPNTPVPGGPSEVDTPVKTPNPHLAITKTPSQTTYKLGDTITYTFHVTNDGNVPMTGVGVSDTFTTGGTGTTGAMNCPQNTLATGASMDCTMTYAATQADVDNAKIDNSATATGTPVGGGNSFTTPPATAEVTDTPAPSLSLVKSIDQAKYVDQNNDGLKDAGDLMAWTFVVTNTGNVTLGGMYGYDPLLVNAPNVTLTCPAYTLAPGASELCSTTQYTITTDDQDAGAVSNTAFAFGYTPGHVPPQGDLPAPDPGNPGYTQSNDSSANQPLEAPTPRMSVTKTASTSTFTAGDTITYTFHVSNDGNVPLTNVQVNDQFTTGGAGAASTVQCPGTTLAVGGAMDCTMTYVATQADANAGQVVNRATATGTPPSGTPITTPPSTATVTDTPNPSLTMTKSVNMSFYHDVNGDGLVDAGDTIAYAFAVVNTGNVTLTNLTINDPMLAAAGDTITCPQTSLEPNDHTTCFTRAYTITDADQSAGVVHNTATATGTPPTGNPVTTPPSDTTTPVQTPKPHISVVKTSSTETFTAGQTITYSFAVTNDGNVPLSDIKVDDTFSPAVDGTVGDMTCPQTSLTAGSSMTCTMTYVTTQADVDRGAITNTATATGTPPTGSPVTSTPSTVTVTDTSSPRLTLAKSVSTPVDVNGNGLTDAGDTVTYAFVVTNHGNVTMSNLAIDDPMLKDAGVAISCPVTGLAPGESTTCTSATYTITAADVASGSVDNTATANATPPGSTTPVPSNDSSTTTPTTTPNPHLTLVKTANTSTFTAGQTVTYLFKVTNDGNVAMNDVRVADTFTSGGSGKAGAVSCPASSLAVGASMTCTMTYVANQADVDAGTLTNSATATGTPPGGTATTTPPSTVTITSTASPSLSLVKHAGTPSDVNSDGLTDAGDTIAYTFTVTNTGNVTMSNLTVDDALLSKADPAVTILCPVTTLAPGASTTCTATPYTVTAADVDAGSVKNTATANATPPGSTTPVPSNDSSTTTPTTKPAPAITLAKKVADAAGTSTAKAGDTLKYTFTVTNTGNVALSNVGIADTFTTGGTGTLSAITCPSATLAAGASMDCTASYTVTQADVDAGKVANSATVSGTPPTGDGGTVTSPPSTASIPTPNSSSLSLVKSASTPVDANGDGLVDTGDTMTFSFLVTNTGDVTMSNLVINDPMLAGATVAVNCPMTTLAPGASTTCTSGTYTITSADTGNGAVTNSATAQATPPGSTTPVTSPPSGTTTPTTVPVSQLALTKAVSDASGDGTATLGEKLTYTFTLTNQGNVALTDLSVSDDFTTGAKAQLTGITCAATTLAPGAKTTCTGTHTVTQADVDAGHIDNTATAHGTPKGSTTPVDSPPATATIPTPNDASLSLVKSVADASGDKVAQVGEKLTYSFVVKNTGSVTMSGITVADDFTTGGTGTMSAITCPDTTLAPGASTTCTATYTVTQADVDAGSIANTATASGNTPTGSKVDTPPSKASIPTDSTAALTLVKKAGTPTDVNGDGLTDAGDTIVYTFTVTNSGAVTMSNVSIDDQLLSKADPAVSIRCSDTTLAPGASTTCTSTAYTITAADVTAGTVHNSATAQGTPPGSTTPVPSKPSTTDTPTTTPNPAMTLVKSVKSDTGKDTLVAGDTLDYSFAVTNTGNVTLTGLSVSDTFDTGGTGTMSAITCPSTSLAPGASTTCTATYTVTQADVDAGTVKNHATASGSTPPGDGGTVTTPPSNAQFPGNPSPELTLVKKAGTPVDVNADGVTDAGDTITYTFSVTNTGNVSMANVGITDTKLTDAGVTIGCDATSLAPGASTTCTSTAYTITGDDVTAGQVENTATAQGTPPGSTTPVPSKPSTTDTPTVTPKPAMTLVKTVSDASGDKSVQAGETLTYTFTIKNTGNVVLTKLSVDDHFTTGGTGVMSDITCPSTPLAPGATTACTATYVVTQADVDAGGVTNAATATGTPPGGTTPVTTPPSTVTIPSTQTPAIRLVKSASLVDHNGDGVGNVGEVINYSFIATNTGTVTLYDITVSDPMLKLSNARCADGPLAPGDSVTCIATGSHTITQADVDAGKVDNTATVTGDDRNPKTTNPTGSSSTSTPTTQKSQLDLVKDIDKTSWVDANKDGLWDAGDTYKYVFTITNTGDVTLGKVGVSDPMLDTAKVGTTCAATTLAPGAKTTCTSTPYTVTDADQKNGEVDNTATAQGTPPGSTTPVNSPPTDKTVPLTAPNPGLVLSKSVADTTSKAATAQLGDKLVYTFVLTNTGNVTLSRPSVDDAMLKAAKVAITCPAGPLAPGASLTCTSGEYTVTQTDVGAGKVSNTATAHGTTPGGGDTPSNPSGSNISTADIGLLKSARSVTDTNGDGITDAGDQIVWGFQVTNSGKQALTDVTVNDKTLADRGVSLGNCVFETLAVGESKTCESSAYTITAADEKAGLVHNVATAQGTTVPGGPTSTPTDSTTPTSTPTGPSTGPSDSTSPSSPASSPSDSTSPTSTPTTPGGGTVIVSPPSPVDVQVLTPRPALDIVKTVEDANRDGVGQLDEKLTYSFVVTNTGNVTLENVSVVDPMFGDAVKCPRSTLKVGEDMTCTAMATVSQTNVDAGLVKNTATSKGNVPGHPDTPVVSPPGTVSIPVPGGPAISLTKKATLVDANGNGGADAGEKVDYTFTITNTGKVTLHDVTLVDAMLDKADPKVTYEWGSNKDHVLAPGASVTVVASAYTVTAADVKNGSIENTATATGTPPTGKPVDSTGHATVPVAPQPTPTPTPTPTLTPTPTPSQSTPPVVTPTPTPTPTGSMPPVVPPTQPTWPVTPTHPAQPTTPSSPSGPHGRLPHTGSDVTSWEVGLGIMATLLGAGLLLAGRRRRRG